MHTKHPQNGKSWRVTRYKIFKDKQGYCTLVDTLAKMQNGQVLKMRRHEMTQNDKKMIRNTCVFQKKGARPLRHDIGLNMTVRYICTQINNKSKILSKIFNMVLKLGIRIWVPIVALAGDACPLWAWQGFRSLDEQTTPKTISEQLYWKQENYSTMYKRWPRATEKLSKAFTSVIYLILIHIPSRQTKITILTYFTIHINIFNVLIR
jgi:hypothetical protein